MPFKNKNKGLANNPRIQRNPEGNRDWTFFVQELERFLEVDKFNTVTKFKTADVDRDTTTTLADDDELAGWTLLPNKHYSIEAYLVYTQNVGNLKFKFDPDQTIQAGDTLTYWSTDETKVQDNDLLLAADTEVTITTMTDTDTVGLIIRGSLHAHQTATTTLDFQWSQGSSSANNTSTLAVKGTILFFISFATRKVY